MLHTLSTVFVEELEAGEMVHSLIDDIPESGSFTSMLDDDQVCTRGEAPGYKANIS